MFILVYLREPAPLLFLIFINDLPLHVSNKVRLYADDTILYSYIYSMHMNAANYKRILTPSCSGHTSGKSAGLKVGRMTQTMWVTWVTFLMGQVGLIRKLNFLDVTRIF